MLGSFRDIAEDQSQSLLPLLHMNSFKAANDEKEKNNYTSEKKKKLKKSSRILYYAVYNDYFHEKHEDISRDGKQKLGYDTHIQKFLTCTLKGLLILRSSAISLKDPKTMVNLMQLPSGPIYGRKNFQH